MNIEEIRKQIEQSQNEIVHLNDEIRNLNQARDNMTEETYNSELEKINRYIEVAQKNLENSQRINRAYDNMLRNIQRLNLLSAYAKKETDRKNLEEIAEERERLEEEIKSSRKVLPEELQKEIRNTILTGTNTNQIPNSANNQQKNNLDTYELDENGNIRFFDGTVIAKPRDRKPNETDQEYVDFLAGYYNNIRNLNMFSPKRMVDKELTKDNSMMQNSETKNTTQQKKERKKIEIPELNLNRRKSNSQEHQPKETPQNTTQGKGEYSEESKIKIPEFLLNGYNSYLQEQQQKGNQQKTSNPKETSPENDRIVIPNFILNMGKNKANKDEHAEHSERNTSERDNKELEATNILVTKKFKFGLSKEGKLYNIIQKVKTAGQKIKAKYDNRKERKKAKKEQKLITEEEKKTPESNYSEEYTEHHEITTDTNKQEQRKESLEANNIVVTKEFNEELRKKRKLYNITQKASKFIKTKYADIRDKLKRMLTLGYDDDVYEYEYEYDSEDKEKLEEINNNQPRETSPEKDKIIIPEFLSNGYNSHLQEHPQKETYQQTSQPKETLNSEENSSKYSELARMMSIQEQKESKPIKKGL